MSTIREFFSLKIYPNDEINRKNKILHTLWLSYWIFFFVIFVLGFFLAKNLLGTTLIFLITSIFLFVVGILKNRGYIKEASILFISMIWITITLFSFLAGGLLNILSAFFIVLIVITGVLLGVQYAILVLIASSVAGLIYTIINEYYYKFPVLFLPHGLNDWLLFTFFGILVLVPIALDLTALENSLIYAKGNANQYKELSDSLDLIVKKRTSELEQSNNDLKSFTYAISHDFRSHLNQIDNFSSVIIENYANKINNDILKSVTKIKENSKRMNILFEELLRFFKLTQQPLLYEIIDMSKLINTALNQYDKEIKERNIRIIQNELKSCFGDKELLFQVWINLFSNAIKYTRNQPEPFIEIGQKNDISGNPYYVKDNGIGFDMNNTSNLFTEFQRLQDDYEGYGLGLALCKRIVESHKGSIWADSKVNEGTTFYFTIKSEKS